MTAERGGGERTASGGQCPVMAGAGVAETYDPFNASQVADPFSVWAAARATSPVFFSPILESWVVTQASLVKQVLQDPTTFKSGNADRSRPLPEAVSGLLAEKLSDGVTALRATDGPQHQLRRRAVQTAISSKRLSDMEPGFRAIANELIDTFRDAGACELYGAFAYPYPLRVISRLLGFADDTAEDLHRWANSRVSLWWGDLTLQQQLRAAEDLVEFYAFLREEVARRRVSPGEDLISLLLAQNDDADRPLTTAELVEAASGLVVAGHESTANWLTQMVFYLLRQGRWSEAHGAAANRVVEESLRFDGPVMGVFRRAAADASVGDARIATGDRVFCALSSANRDEGLFDEPDQLVLDRPDASRHLAFGNGVHTCVGAAIARLEGRIALEALHDRLPGLRLLTDDLEFAPNLSLRMPQALRLGWDR